jgi:hypothetical protein
VLLDLGLLLYMRTHNALWACANQDEVNMQRVIEQAGQVRGLWRRLVRRLARLELAMIHSLFRVKLTQGSIRHLLIMRTSVGAFAS